MQTMTTIGLDIAKSVFQVHGVDAGGQVIVPHQKAEHMAATTNAAKPSRKLLPNRSRPHMALLRRVGASAMWSLSGQSGRCADIAFLQRLTRTGSRVS